MERGRATEMERRIGKDVEGGANGDHEKQGT